MSRDNDMTTTRTNEAPNNSSNSRLMITKMELENFKSYAGTKEIGPFHKCFSAVVGPNGSGKSNVIDAMLFVFGKRAKKLRLNKVSELIHKSDSVKNNPPKFARVSVYFQEIIDTGDGDDDYNIVPNSNIIITRIAKKDNTSNYKLNGKNSSFKDVAAYLGSKGIDLDNNRFLILQGEVEMISMMPPTGKTENDEGLLEYLEDIIGSSKYVEETNIAEQQVEELTELRQEKLNRVKAVQKEKDNLEGAKQEAEALLGKERDIRRKKNILYQIKKMNQTKDLQESIEKKKEVVAKLEAERQKTLQEAERIKETETALRAQRKEHDKISQTLTQTKEEFASYERQNIKLCEEIKHIKKENKKIETKIKTETNKEENAIANQKEAEENIPCLEQKLHKLNEQKATEDEKLEKIYDEMKGVTQTLRTQLEEKTQELAPVQKERVQFQNALDTAVTEIKLLQDSTRRARDKLSGAQQELDSLGQKQQTKRDQLQSFTNELNSARTRLNEAQNEEQQLADKESSLAKRSNDLMARSEEMKAAIQATGSSAARSPAVRSILKAAKKGGELSNSGILGRLGDLATTSQKYDVAVSTACGMLDHIVVQTTAGAQKCLEYLRKHSLGRANFIPLDKMQKGAHDRVVQTPEGAPRLFEVITPSNFSVTPAIFLAVGQTLVAPDLETATRWAYDFSKRWRVVTLDGKLIETAGTMSGGGKSLRRGGMRLANSATSTAAPIIDQDSSVEECKRLEQEAAQAHDFLLECRKRRRQLSDEIRSLQKTIKQLEVQIPKLTVEISGCDTTREKLTKLIPELRSKCELTEEDTSRLEQLNEKKAKCKTDMASCAKLATKLEAEVARLQNEILTAGGTKLSNQQRTCEQILLDINDAEKDLNSAKVVITTSKKSVTKSRNAKENSEKQLKTSEQILQQKEEELKLIEKDAQKVEEHFEKVKEVEAEKRKSLEAVSKDCEDLKKTHAEAKCVEIDLLGQIESFDRIIAGCNKKIRHWKAEISKLVEAEKTDDLYDISDDEGGDEEDDLEQEDNPNNVVVETDGDVQMQDSSQTQGIDKMNDAEEEKSSLPNYLFSSLEKYSIENVQNDIDVLEGEHKSLAKNANMGAITEYRKKEVDYLARVAELDEVTEQRNAVRKIHEELRRKRLEMFMDGFGKITLKLKEMYQMITLGGDAELELVDSLDPFSEGIVFSVRPPKKSWKNIGNLSGGEKTLSSLALVFALHHYKPTPLYVMDEIDAALDFRNVSIVANYIKERTKNAQFVIISLRNNMFELADRLVGIYKTNNCTKSVTIDPRAFGVAAQHVVKSVQKSTSSTPLAECTNVSNASEIPTSVP